MEQKLKVLLLFCFLTPFTGHTNDDIRVVDGDTIVIEDDVYRLYGIDAPEIAQNCVRNGKNWKCGIDSSNQLLAVTATGVNCTQDNKDKYSRWLGICTTPDGMDINGWMVEQGWAVAYIKYSNKYVAQEQAARSQGLGIWSSEFEQPEDFRRIVWESQGSDAPDPNCPIKGNINSKKVKIYHTPWGSQHYSRTKINTNKGERWFCTEKEAMLAGWRAPYR